MKTRGSCGRNLFYALFKSDSFLGSPLLHNFSALFEVST